MTSKDWDAFTDVLERTLKECRNREWNDAMTAWQLAHAALEFIEARPKLRLQ